MPAPSTLPAPSGKAPAKREADLICERCEAHDRETSATRAFDRWGEDVPAGSKAAEAHLCEECVTYMLERQAGCYAGCE